MVLEGEEGLSAEGGADNAMLNPKLLESLPQCNPKLVGATT